MSTEQNYQSKVASLHREIKSFRTLGFEDRKIWLFRETGYLNDREPKRPIDWERTNIVLNEALGLGWEPRTLAVLTLVDEALAKVIRFRDDPHMQGGMGDSTAAHQKQCLLMMHQVFEEAELTKTQKQNYRDMMVAIGLHDAGEAMGEATTVAGLAKTGNLTGAGNGDKETFEREITAFVIKLADYAVSQGNPSIFHDVITDITATADIETRGTEGLAEVPALLEKYARQYGLGGDYPLSDQLQHYLACYTEVETEDNHSFMRTAVKNVERIHGNRYLMRNAGLGEGGIPLKHTISNRMLTSLLRNERGLPEMFRLASTPEERAIAIEVAKTGYRTALEYLDKSPPIMDRNVTPASEPPLSTPEAAEENAVAKYRERLPMVQQSLRENGSLFARHDQETVLRLRVLYNAALKAVSDGTYVPAEPLATLESVPDVLQPYIQEQWELEKSQPLHVVRWRRGEALKPEKAETLSREEAAAKMLKYFKNKGEIRRKTPGRWGEPWPEGLADALKEYCVENVTLRAELLDWIVSGAALGGPEAAKAARNFLEVGEIDHSIQSGTASTLLFEKKQKLLLSLNEWAEGVVKEAKDSNVDHTKAEQIRRAADGVRSR